MYRKIIIALFISNFLRASEEDGFKQEFDIKNSIDIKDIETNQKDCKITNDFKRSPNGTDLTKNQQNFLETNKNKTFDKILSADIIDKLQEFNHKDTNEQKINHLIKILNDFASELNDSNFTELLNILILVYSKFYNFIASDDPEFYVELSSANDFINWIQVELRSLEENPIRHDSDSKKTNSNIEKYDFCIDLNDINKDNTIDEIQKLEKSIKIYEEEICNRHLQISDINKTRMNNIKFFIKKLFNQIVLLMNKHTKLELNTLDFKYQRKIDDNFVELEKTQNLIKKLRENILTNYTLQKETENLLLISKKKLNYIQNQIKL